MKTDALIDALTADHAVPPPRLGPGLMLGVAVDGAIAIVLFFILLGVRPDIANAAHSARFLFKYVFALSLAAGTGFVLMRLLRPGTPPLIWPLAVAPALLAVAVALEMLALPSNAWSANLFSPTWLGCLASIPTLSLGPLIALLLTLRRGAPTNPTAAGAAIGLLAGGIGAFVYASHCPGDSPFFVAAWYSATIAFMTIIGAIIGRRFLSW